MTATQAYLRRIGCSETVGLPELQRRHLMAVPFENLDILRGSPLGTADDVIRDKIVDRSRGGLCFELNRSFGQLLGELGFAVTLIAAEVAYRDGFVEGVDHPLLLVEADSLTWLVDVGFGGFSYLEPLRWDSTQPQSLSGVTYRIQLAGAHRVVLRAEADGAEVPMFRTALWPVPRSWRDFDSVREFHESSPDSPFTRKLICSKATATGQVLLTGRRLAVIADGKRTETDLDPGGPVFGAALAWILHGDGQIAPALELGLARQSTPSILD
ncbi:arylamine N-acetyltransferase family protein [Nocardia iowensis]|uniref:Arylamine N-acetyltransferase n=1 Tax=Nocardia iowensis TaxID=204891 RepID=A0ABX8RK65_NOCIO|nr:arylamine N-acetyltransferase [Nocardia iowensis]QXN89382.1 arylamine N-acetyltransferase [Nocardia iowensis]